MTQTPIDTRLTAPVFGALCFLSVLWGASFFFVELALPAFPPLTIAALRVSIAVFTLALYLLATGRTISIPVKFWPGFLILGALNNAIPFTLISWAQQEITGGLASIFNATTPLWAIVVSHYALSDERMAPGRLAGVIAGIIGVAILIGPAALKGLNAATLALIAMVTATFAYACAGVWARRLSTFSASEMTLGQLAGSSLLLLPIAFAIEQPWTDLANAGWSPLLGIIGLATASTSIGYIFYFRILKRAGATNVLLVTFLVPVTAIVLGMLFLDETLLPRHLAGMAVIGLGLIFVDGRLLKKFRPSQA